MTSKSEVYWVKHSDEICKTRPWLSKVEGPFSFGEVLIAASYRGDRVLKRTELVHGNDTEPSAS